MIKSKVSVPVFILERTSKKMKHAFQRVLKKWNTNLTADQWVVLQCLQEHDGLTQFEIGQKTYKDAPTLTRIIDKLVNKNMPANIKSTIPRVPDIMFVRKRVTTTAAIITLIMRSAFPMFIFMTFFL